MSPAAPPTRSPRLLYLALGLMLLTLVVFGRSVTFDFVDWDDIELVVNDPLLNPPTMANMITPWRGPVNMLYTPLAYNAWQAVSLVARTPTADAFGGTLNPMIFHTLTLLLHCGCVLAVFAILLQLTDSPWPAAIGAAVFAIHPLQVEPVAWISGMNNVLAGLFVMVAVATYIRFARGPHPARWYMIAAIAIVAGLCSKPTAIVGPLMILLLDWLILRRPIKTVLLAAGPLFLLAIPFIFIGRNAQVANEIAAPSLGDRFSIMIDAIGFYVAKIFWPGPLMFDYARTPAWVIVHGPAVASIVGAIIAGLITVVALAMGWFRAAGVVLLFIAGVIVVSGITPFTFQYYSTVADRYAYLSMLAPAIGLAMLLQRIRERPVLPIAGAMVAVFAVVSFIQVGTWADATSLATHELQHIDRSFAAHDMLAAVARRDHDSATAEAQLRQALQIWPDEPYCNLNLGQVIMDTQPAEAIEHFNKSLRWGYREPKLLYPLGLTLMKTGRPAEAEPILSELVQRDPNSVPGLATLGYAQAALGKLSAAELSFRRALAIEPAYPLALSGLQKVLAMKK